MKEALDEGQQRRMQLQVFWNELVKKEKIRALDGLWHTLEVSNVKLPRIEESLEKAFMLSLLLLLLRPLPHSKAYNLAPTTLASFNCRKNIHYLNLKHYTSTTMNLLKFSLKRFFDVRPQY